jgi:hypothetical protein
VKALVLKTAAAAGAGLGGGWFGWFQAEVGDVRGARGELEELAQLRDLGGPQLFPGDAEEGAAGLAALEGLGGDLEGVAEEFGGVAGDLEDRRGHDDAAHHVAELADVVGLQRELAERAGVVLGEHVQQAWVRRTRWSR